MNSILESLKQVEADLLSKLESVKALIMHYGGTPKITAQDQQGNTGTGGSGSGGDTPPVGPIIP